MFKNHKFYTKEEDELILSFKGKTKELAAKLNTTVKSICDRRRLKYKETPKPTKYEQITPLFKQKENKPLVVFARPSFFENEDVITLAKSRR